MTAFHQALFRFWSGFSHDGEPLAAYLAGQVPTGAKFPYITFDVINGDGFGSNLLTAFVWCQSQNGKSANPQRAAILDQIAAAIPTQGKRINFDGGFVMLYRNPANFQSYYDDPEDKTVLGGRVSCEVVFYSA